MLANSDFKILIVDDQKTNIQIVLNFLEDEGYNLSFNTNPKKALERIYNEHFDLILLDINMPELDGFDLCEAIKKDPQTKDIPVIFLSADHNEDTIADAFYIGGVDYLTKPFNRLELIARVDTHIKMQKYIQELREKQEKLAKIIATDAQTGLPNRLRFISIIKQKISAIESDPSRLSIASMKIDNLSKINAIHGYQAGDKSIMEITKILKDSIPERFILARLFSSHFIVLMENTSLEASKTISQKLLTKIRDSKATKLKITCSIGLAEYRLNEDYEKFMHRAEKLMLEVSNDGGNMIGYS